MLKVTTMLDAVWFRSAQLLHSQDFLENQKVKGFALKLDLESLEHSVQQEESVAGDTGPLFSLRHTGLLSAVSWGHFCPFQACPTFCYCYKVHT